MKDPVILRNSVEGMHIGGMAIELGWTFAAQGRDPERTDEQKEAMQETLAELMEAWIRTLPDKYHEAVRHQVNEASKS